MSIDPEQAALLAADLESAPLEEDNAQTVLDAWYVWARESQLPPSGDWRVWLLLAGRGFGKTRAGAEWVRAQAESGAAARIALVAPTARDARLVMVEGDSGLLAIASASVVTKRPEPTTIKGMLMCRSRVSMNFLSCTGAEIFEGDWKGDFSRILEFGRSNGRASLSRRHNC